MWRNGNYSLSVLKSSVFPDGCGSGRINQVITTYEFGDVFATAEGVWDVSPIPKFQAGFRAYFEKGTVYFNQRVTLGQPDGRAYGIQS